MNHKDVPKFVIQVLYHDKHDKNERELAGKGINFKTRKVRLTHNSNISFLHPTQKTENEKFRGSKFELQTQF